MELPPPVDGEPQPHIDERDGGAPASREPRHEPLGHEPIALDLGRPRAGHDPQPHRPQPRGPRLGMHTQAVVDLEPRHSDASSAMASWASNNRATHAMSRTP